MGIKLSQDPARLEEELRGANERIRSLYDQVSTISRERQEHQRVAAERDEAVAVRQAAEEALGNANQRIASLEQELDSEVSARAAERRQVEAAQALKRAFEAL